MARVQIVNNFMNVGWNKGDIVEMDDDSARELEMQGAVAILKITEKPKEVVKHVSKSKSKTKNTKRN